jgi:hypothetical protein
MKGWRGVWSAKKQVYGREEGAVGGRYAVSLGSRAVGRLGNSTMDNG